MSVLFLGSTLLGALGFCALLLPLGYALCYAARVANFRQLPRSTQTLWSVVVGTPVGVMLSVLLERVFSVQAVSWGAVVAAVLGWAFLLSQGKGPALPPAQVKYVRWGMLLAAGLGLYVMLAGLPIQVGDRLYDSLSTADLSVRVPLVQMATEHGVPVINPFNSIDGVHPAMRYYYYWYILCGVVARVFHLPARAALTASGAWAALLLLSSGFLLLSTLFRPRETRFSIRLLSLLTVPVGLIIGLDILPVASALLLHPPVLYPDPDYWRSSSDFAPSFNLALLYAPHHIAGIAISFALFLLICPPIAVGMLPERDSESRGQAVARSLVAGLLLATLVGTSTYMGMFACLGALFVLVQRVRIRDWRTLAVILGGAAFGLLLSVPFLYEITHVPAHLQLAQQHTRPLRFAIHSLNMTKDLYMGMYYRAGVVLNRPLELLLRLVLWLLLILCEVGFLGVILVMRIRQDWNDRHALLPRQRYQWMLLFALGIPGLLLSSSSIAGSNDLSRHAEVCLRFFGVLWAVPIVARFLLDRGWRKQVRHTWVVRAALVLVVLGLATQLYQIVAQRFYAMYSQNIAIAHAGQYRRPWRMELFAHDIFYGFQSLQQPGVPAGNILYSPMGDYYPTMNLYQTRYAVAGEKNCMTSFGGDVKRCKEVVPSLLRLFGGGQLDDETPVGQPYEPARMTLAAMDQACLQNKAAAVIVTSSDKVWGNKDSFVWSAPVLYSTPRVRVLRCPDSQ